MEMEHKSHRVEALHVITNGVSYKLNSW